MIYTDDMAPSENDYKMLSKNYNIMLASDHADISEIQKKMQKQRDFLYSLNDFENKQKILDAFDSNIAELNNIISTRKDINQQYNTSKLYNYSRQFSPLYKNTIAQDVENGAYSPFRSMDEMQAHGQLDSLPQTPLPSSPIPPTNPIFDLLDDLDQAIPPIVDSPTPNENTPNLAPNTPNNENNQNENSAENNANLPNNNTNQNGDNINTPPDNENNTNLPNNTDSIVNENDGNTNNPSLNIPEPNAPTQKIFKRNSPMQSNNLFNVAKRFNVNLQNMFRFKNNKKAPNKGENTQNTSHTYYNLKTQTIDFENKLASYTNNTQHSKSLFKQNATSTKSLGKIDENTVTEIAKKHLEILKNKHHCSPYQIALDNQIDIVRLLLLYLMLRPNCRYTGKITKLANTQFDIFLQVKAMTDQK